MSKREHLPQPSDNEAYLSIAEDLSSEMNARLKGETEGIIDLDQAWDDSIRKVGARALIAELEKMEPRDLLQLYLRHVGEDEYAATIKKIVELKAQEMERAARLQSIQAETRATGILRLEHMRPSEIVRIGLFKPRNIRDAYKNSSIPASRILATRIIDPLIGLTEVVNDNYPTIIAQRPTPLKPFTQLQIGQKLADSQDLVTPRISIHAPLAYFMEDEHILTEEIVGYAETADSTLLMTGYM
jgi:hypothetical protein